MEGKTRDFTENLAAGKAGLLLAFEEEVIGRAGARREIERNGIGGLQYE